MAQRTRNCSANGTQIHHIHKDPALGEECWSISNVHDSWKLKTRSIRDCNSVIFVMVRCELVLFHWETGENRWIDVFFSQVESKSPSNGCQFNPAAATMNNHCLGNLSKSVGARPLTPVTSNVSETSLGLFSSLSSMFLRFIIHH